MRLILDCYLIHYSFIRSCSFGLLSSYALIMKFFHFGIIHFLVLLLLCIEFQLVDCAEVFFVIGLVFHYSSFIILLLDTFHLFLYYYLLFNLLIQLNFFIFLYFVISYVNFMIPETQNFNLISYLIQSEFILFEEHLLEIIKFYQEAF